MSFTFSKPEPKRNGQQKKCLVRIFDIFINRHSVGCVGIFIYRIYMHLFVLLNLYDKINI